MSGRADSDTHPEQAESAESAEHDEQEQRREGADTAGRGGMPQDRPGDEHEDAQEGEHEDAEEGEHSESVREARRARWVCAGTGAALTVAGLAAALLRLTRAAPPLVPVAYACGAAVCALAAVLGSRGRTRRALWLLIAGLMVMALGDQFD